MLYTDPMSANTAVSPGTTGHPNADPSGILVIFGATGDAARRRIFPALWRLRRQIRPRVVIGVARGKKDKKEFLEIVEQAMRKEASRTESSSSSTDIANGVANGVADFLQHIRFIYVKGDLNKNSTLAKVGKKLNGVRRKGLLSGASPVSPERLIFFSTVPPDAHSKIVSGLAAENLNRFRADDGLISYLIFDKPVGRDAETAQELNKLASEHFENRVFRLDHYQCKPMIQKILPLRRRYEELEGVLHKAWIKRIFIRADEYMGVPEGRTETYDKLGALRDMIQSHLLRTLCHLCMSLPKPDDASGIDSAATAVLTDTKLAPHQSIDDIAKRGRYKGYDGSANIETYVALVLHISNKRWDGVPIHLRTGKALKAKNTSITVEFEFGDRLIFQVDPKPCILLNESNSTNGTPLKNLAHDIQRKYHTVTLSAEEAADDGYEGILKACMEGDSSISIGEEWINRSWLLLDPIIARWEEPNKKPLTYLQGTNGLPEDTDPWTG